VSARSKPDSCLNCECYSHGTDFSQIEGTGSSGVMLVGEASGEHEQRDQLPFRPFAPAGGVLERVIRRMGLDRSQFSITNVVRCRPRHNWLEKSPWEYAAINHCRPNLNAAIAERKPRCIVALGGIAMRELTGLSGNAQGISHLAGYVLPLADRKRKIVHRCGDCEPGNPTPNCLLCGGAGTWETEEWCGGPDAIPVIGDFHPAFLRRGKASHQGVFARILQRAMNIAKGTDRSYLWNVQPEGKETHGGLRYVTRPGLEEVRGYYRRIVDNPGAVVSYDLETFESTSLDEDAREGFADTNIRLVQFSTEPREGIAFPWEGAYREVARDILHTPNVKCGHNVWLFDNKVLRAAGEREGLDLMPRGIVHDTLQMFHHWQPDLPAHLQFAAGFVQFPFPWKHLAGTDLEFYGCCDVDATLRLYTMLTRTLQRDQLWGDSQTGYIGQVLEVRPVLAAMEDRGVPIDDAARIALGAEFEKAQGLLGAELSKLAPKECCRVQPKEGYKGVPPEVKKLEGMPLDDIYVKRFKEPDSKKKDGSIDEGEWYHYEQRVFEFPDDDLKMVPVTRWCRVYDFNPNSRNQVLDYMRAKGHPIPKSKEEDDEGNQKDTTGEKYLRRLANKTGDAFYLKVIEYRGFTKLRGTYVEGFKPGSDGCVHTTFTFDTSIGQLSSRNPNVQNFVKLKPTPELAKSMRAMICAKPGHIITEWDYKSFHVLTLGFLAEDPTWMRLARLDMHSFFTGHVLGLWDGFTVLKESDEELMARFKWLKSNPEWKNKRDGQFKRCTLGIGNGLRAKGLYERYMEDFPPQTCKRCAGLGTVDGIRGLKKCSECKGSGFISGLRIVQEIMDALEKLAPRIFAYQRAERRAAHEAGDRGYFSKHWGFARRFYEVYNFSKQWRRSPEDEPPPGDQSEEAVSFRHTNIAHCEMRARMKELHYSGMAERYGMFNQIHDSLQFHFRENLLEQHIADVHPVLSAPSKVLKHPTIAPNGLEIGVEGSWGRSWDKMQEISVTGHAVQV
jgi:uracil-DNA glycosylase family 4